MSRAIFRHRSFVLGVFTLLKTKSSSPSSVAISKCLSVCVMLIDRLVRVSSILYMDLTNVFVIILFFP